VPPRAEPTSAPETVVQLPAPPFAEPLGVDAPGALELDAGEAALEAAVAAGGLELEPDVDTALLLQPASSAPADAIARAKDTAMNPAVLEAFALAIIAGGHATTYPGIPGHESDLALARKDAGRIDQSMAELRKMAPNAGSYVSETNFFEPSWQEAFWGPNYPRLLSIKKKFDPIGLFFVHHGVGSEEWSADGFTRLSAR